MAAFAISATIVLISCNQGPRSVLKCRRGGGGGGFDFCHSIEQRDSQNYLLKIGMTSTIWVGKLKPYSPPPPLPRTMVLQTTHGILKYLWNTFLSTNCNKKAPTCLAYVSLKASSTRALKSWCRICASPLVQTRATMTVVVLWKEINFIWKHLTTLETWYLNSVKLINSFFRMY